MDDPATIIERSQIKNIIGHDLKKYHLAYRKSMKRDRFILRFRANHGFEPDILYNLRTLPLREPIIIRYDSNAERLN